MRANTVRDQELRGEYCSYDGCYTNRGSRMATVGKEFAS